MGLTIGMVSWGAEQTLANTLESYSRYKLRAEQKIIVLQQGTKEQKDFVYRHGFSPITLLGNVGIARAYKMLLEATTQENFLFLENDWELIADPQKEIQVGQDLLSSGEADIVRYRHRRYPGNPLWTRQFEGNEYSKPVHLLDSIHWTDPTKFPEIVSREFDSGVWYKTTAQYANWTNNPHMGRTDFLKYYIYPRMGSRDLEVDIQDWWQHQFFRVYQGEGLFTHNRLD